MDMREFLDTKSNAHIKAVATECGTKVSYMRHIGCGFKRPSALLARRLDEATAGELSKEELRPDVFGESESIA